MINNLTILFLKYRKSFWPNLLFGLFLLIIGTINLINRAELIDGYYYIRYSYALWVPILAILFGYRATINAIDMKKEPRFQRQTKEWMLKNNVTEEMLN